MAKLTTCECGCNGIVTPGRRFVNGHNQRGVSVSESTKTKIRDALSGEKNVYFGITGEAHPGYRNAGRHTDRKGYVYILVHQDHPLYVMAKPKGQSHYITEHRLVMAEAIGRPLASQEEVHHVDENPTNNDLGNLMLFANKGEHAAHHRALERQK